MAMLTLISTQVLARYWVLRCYTRAAQSPSKRTNPSLYKPKCGDTLRAKITILDLKSGKRGELPPRPHVENISYETQAG
jgi:hypothetical protein